MNKERLYDLEELFTKPADYIEDWDFNFNKKPNINDVITQIHDYIEDSDFNFKFKLKLVE